MRNRQFDPEAYLDEEFDRTDSRWYSENEPGPILPPIRATLPSGEEVGIHDDTAPNIGTLFEHGGQTYRTVRVSRDIDPPTPQWVVTLARE